MCKLLPDRQKKYVWHERAIFIIIHSFIPSFIYSFKLQLQQTYALLHTSSLISLTFIIFISIHPSLVFLYLKFSQWVWTDFHTRHTRYIANTYIHMYIYIYVCMLHVNLNGIFKYVIIVDYWRNSCGKQLQGMTGFLIV